MIVSNHFTKLFFILNIFCSAYQDMSFWSATLSYKSQKTSNMISLDLKLLQLIYLTTKMSSKLCSFQQLVTKGVSVILVEAGFISHRFALGVDIYGIKK